MEKTWERRNFHWGENIIFDKRGPGGAIISYSQKIFTPVLIWTQSPEMTGSGSTKKRVVKTKAVDPDPTEHGEQFFLP